MADAALALPFRSATDREPCQYRARQLHTVVGLMVICARRAQSARWQLRCIGVSRRESAQTRRDGTCAGIARVLER
jgi:hypothetical protein